MFAKMMTPRGGAAYKTFVSLVSVLSICRWMGTFNLYSVMNFKALDIDVMNSKICIVLPCYIVLHV